MCVTGVESHLHGLLLQTLGEHWGLLYPDIGDLCIMGSLYSAHVGCVAGVESFLHGWLSQALGEHWGLLYPLNVECVAGVESHLHWLLLQACGKHGGHWGFLHHTRVERVAGSAAHRCCHWQPCHAGTAQLSPSLCV